MQFRLPPVNPRPKNAAHALPNQPPKTPLATPRITYSSGQDHRSSPTTTYTTILLRLPPTSPILTVVTATARSPNDADAILSVVAATVVATTRIVTPTTPASVSRTAKSGGSQPPHIAIRNTTCDKHHCQLPGHRVPLRWISGVLPDVCIVPVALSHCSNTATPLVRSTQVWAYFRMLVFTLGTYGNVRTIHPALLPGNNPRQPTPLVINAVTPIFWVESAMIAVLPRETAATTTTTSTATAWPADTHCGKPSWTLHADQRIQRYQRQAI